MALSPNESGNSQSQPVTFTSKAADRIANAVRKVEAGRRDQVPAVEFGSFLPQKTFRVGKFSGAWPTGATASVTFLNQTTTPNTLSATNLFFDIPADGTKNCAVSRDGTAWYLVQWQWAIATCSTAAG